MSQGYEPQPQQGDGQRQGTSSDSVGAPQTGQALRQEARCQTFEQADEARRPPPGPGPTLNTGKPLTPQSAIEEGEVEQFSELLAGFSIPLAPQVAKKLFLSARAKLLSGDPRMHRLAGDALGVEGSWPTPELIAKIVKAQKGMRGAAPTGVPTVDQLKQMLGSSEKRQASEGLDLNRDLFDPVRGRSDRDGKAAEKQARRPQYRSHSEPFLGIGWTPGSGVNDEMWARLMRAEDALFSQMSEDIDQRGAVDHPAKGAPLTKDRADLKHWVGIRERHRGYKPGAQQGYHKTGSAMDLNYTTNPSMAVRSGKTQGGEAAVGGLLQVATDAIDVIDRAMLWTRGRRAELHVTMRPESNEPVAVAKWAERVWTRFNDASEAVAEYFALGYAVDRDAALAGLLKENEKLVEEGRDEERNTTAILSYKTMLGSVPRRPEPDALERIQSSMCRGRPWSKDPSVVLKRMGPDLLAVAKTMVRGNVSNNPGSVRNPTLGLFDLKKELVQALVSNAGLHWGGCEFGKAYSGDMMHFDLGFVPQALK